MFCKNWTRFQFLDYQNARNSFISYKSKCKKVKADVLSNWDKGGGYFSFSDYSTDKAKEEML